MVIALVPARGGSKRISDKNLQVVGGLTLVAWSVVVGRGVEGIDEVWVSSDSEAILWEGEESGAFAHRRPRALARDDVGDLPVIRDFLQGYPREVDALVYLRPTTPFRRVDVVEAALREFMAAGGSVSGLRSVQELEEPPGKCFGLEYGLLLPYSTWEETEKPAQEFEKVYKANGYVDICRPEVVWGDKGPWGRNVIGYETEPVIEIDTPFQLRLARAFADYRFEGAERMKAVVERHEVEWRARLGKGPQDTEGGAFGI